MPSAALQAAKDQAAAQSAIQVANAHQTEVARLQQQVYERDRTIEKLELAAVSGTALAGANDVEGALRKELADARDVAEAVRKHARLYAEQQASEHARQLAEARQHVGGADRTAAEQDANVATLQSQLAQVTAALEESRKGLSAANERMVNLESQQQKAMVERQAAIAQASVEHARQLKQQAESHAAELASVLAEARATALSMARVEAEAEVAAEHTQL